MSEEMKDKRLEKTSSGKDADSGVKEVEATASSATGRAGGEGARESAGGTSGEAQGAPGGKKATTSRSRQSKAKGGASPDQEEKPAEEAAAEGERKPEGAGKKEEKEASSQDRAGKKEMDEEEFRRLVEESLERVTVEEVTLTVMNQFASLGYMKMGLPESVNLKYRDLSQASLAIDVLEAMIKGAEGKIPEESLKPFRGTLANLQLNYVQLKKRLG